MVGTQKISSQIVRCSADVLKKLASSSGSKSLLANKTTHSQ
jgi:hypothetical protein